MPKLISNIVRGRGFFAPALLAHPKALLVSLGRSSGGYVFVSAGVLAAAVAVVSLLTFLAPDSDRPYIARPVQALQSVLPGVLEQVGGGVAQAATLLGVDQESVQNMRENLREGLAAARSGATGSWAPALASLPEVSTATTTTSSSEEPSSSSFQAMDESPPPPQTASEPSAPSSGGGTGEASAPAVPPATEASPPTTTSEPTSPSVTEQPSPPPPPPPAAEEPPAPPKDEPAPPTTQEPPPPPAAEEPPAPPKDEPAPPTAEEPPPLVTDQPEA